MDISLNTYIFRAEEILNLIDLKSSDKSHAKTHYNEYEIMISYLKNTLIRVEEAFNKFKNRNIKYSPSSEPENGVSQQIAPNLDNAGLDYIQKYDQYCLKFKHMGKDYELYGKRGYIYNKRILQNDKIKAHQVVICRAGNNCYQVLNEKYCKFYHSPKDLEKLVEKGIISQSYYSQCIKLKRNFAHTSWLYNLDTLGNLTRPNSYMRLFADNNLENSINSLYITFGKRLIQDQLNNLEHQIVHDILTYLEASCIFNSILH